MELYGPITARNGAHMDQPTEWIPETGLEESMPPFGWLAKEFYPLRPGAVDCAYYMRTGSCGYGNKCRYNHPRDCSSFVGGSSRIAEEYPERAGEPECQYYLRTGICKFGASCKFHHPRNAGGSLINVPVNIYGYPLRPDEKECSYYLKTGQCKFGVTCKFHHPQPSAISFPASARPFYSTVQSPSAPSPEQHGGGSTNYRVARAPLVSGSYVPSAYGAVLFPAGVVPLSNWSAYSGPVSPVPSPGAQASIGTASLYGVSSLTPTFTGPYPHLPPSAGTSSSSHWERVFPERPGQPDCQYYMKTGDCKFGSACKFHHPPDWLMSKTNCVLSSPGLPLRPGVEPCKFYLQNGHCKFGRTCKFDHPMGTRGYGSSALSHAEMPVTPFILGSSRATGSSSVRISRSSMDFHTSSSLTSSRSTRQGGGSHHSS